MQQSGELSLIELILNASLLVQLVMAFLLGLSVWSWTVIIQRIYYYKTARRKADEFEDRFWSGTDLHHLYQECVKRQESGQLVGLECIYSAGFKEFVRLLNSGQPDQETIMEGTNRQMTVAKSRELESLENHLTALATIGSVSPYIGLFGTVWGIMHAFVALAAVKNATLAMVAPPIAEALIATAMGLIAAIPAVMFYNRFIATVEGLDNRYINFMDEFFAILNRRLVSVRSQSQPGRQGQTQDIRSQQQQMQPQPQQSPQSQHAAGQAGTQYRSSMRPQQAFYGQAGQNGQVNAAQPRQTPQSQQHQAYPGTPPADGPRYITPGVAGDAYRSRGGSSSYRH